MPFDPTKKNGRPAGPNLRHTAVDIGMDQAGDETRIYMTADGIVIGEMKLWASNGEAAKRTLSAALTHLAKKYGWVLSVPASALHS